MKCSHFFLIAFFASTHLVAQNSQNIGVGVPDPDAKLHVRGAIKVDSFQNSHESGAYLEWNKDEFSGRTFLLNQNGLEPGGFVIGAVDTGNMITPQLIIDEWGNLGIGRPLPLAVLDVDRGQAPEGTAAFRGTLNSSHFNMAMEEHTFIRGGKPESNVIINDVGNNVGVGTATPATKLDVLAPFSSARVMSGDTGIYTSYQIGRSDVEGTMGVVAELDQFTMGTQSGDLVLRTESANQRLILNSGSGDATLIVNNGKVGVGITSPLATLDVSRGQATNGTAAFRGTTNISHFNFDISEHTYIRGGKSTSDVIINDQGRYVGIGTANPNVKLDIVGGGIGVRLLSGASGNNTSYQLGRTAAEASFSIAANNGQYALGAVAGDAILRTDVATSALILNAGSGSATLVVKEGKVGIGTTTMASKLDVEGGVSIGTTYSGTTAAPSNGAIIQGIVGIATNAPDGNSKLHVAGKIKIQDGTQGTGKVLKSDANGMASWDKILLSDMIEELPVVNFSCMRVTGTEFNGAEINDIGVRGNYAYLINGNPSDNLQVINISDPTLTTLVGTLPFAAIPNSISISGQYAYVVFMDNTMSVIDISVPTTPMLVVNIPTGGTLPISIAVSDNHAYILHQTSKDVKVINISNPAMPSVVGSVLSGGNSPNSIAISGNYAYVVNTASDNMRVIDISNPVSPALIGSATTGDGPTSVTLAGNYAYVVNSNANSLQVINITTPASPTVTGSVSFNNPGITSRSVAVIGTYAYVISQATDSLKVIDITTPSSPLVDTTIYTGDDPVSIAISGAFAFIGHRTPKYMKNVRLYCNSVFEIDPPTGSFTAQENAWDIYGNNIVSAKTGKVGIGVLTPFSKLDVEGNVTIGVGYSGTNAAPTNGAIIQGNVGIGVTTVSEKLELAGKVKSHGYICRNGVNGSYGGNTFNYYWTGSAIQAWIDDINVGTLQFTSDRRLKDQIEPMHHDAISKIMNLRPVTFQYKTISGTPFKSNPVLQDGFIADELQLVIPSAVNGEKDALTSSGKIQPQTINLAPLVSVLTKAVQEQQEQIELQQSQLDNQSKRINDLIQRLETLEKKSLVTQMITSE